MYPHHRQTLDNITSHLAKADETLGILLVGSIAHGFEQPGSDVDIMVVVPDDVFEERKARGELTAIDLDNCTYDGGYIDIKYVSLKLMDRVRDIGSEPARFAYHGASLVFSRDERIAPLIAEIARYPTERKTDNLKRFFAQIQAWNWYRGEAVKHDNAYLLNHAMDNLILFGGRLLLAENEVLYPSHKWFMRVLSGVREKPDGVMDLIDDVLTTRDAAKIEQLYEIIAGFREWPNARWSHQFMIDSELNWLMGQTPVADI